MSSLIVQGNREVSSKGTQLDRSLDCSKCDQLPDDETLSELIRSILRSKRASLGSLNFSALVPKSYNVLASSSPFFLIHETKTELTMDPSLKDP